MVKNDEELREYFPEQFPVLEGEPEAGQWFPEQ